MKQRTMLVLIPSSRAIPRGAWYGVVNLIFVYELSHSVMVRPTQELIKGREPKACAPYPPSSPTPPRDEVFLLFNFIVYVHSLVAHPFLKEILYPPLRTGSFNTLYM